MKKFIRIVFYLILAGGVFWGGYYFANRNQNSDTSNNIFSSIKPDKFEKHPDWQKLENNFQKYTFYYPQTATLPYGHDGFESKGISNQNSTCTRVETDFGYIAFSTDPLTVPNCLKQEDQEGSEEVKDAVLIGDIYYESDGTQITTTSKPNTYILNQSFEFSDTITIKYGLNTASEPDGIEEEKQQIEDIIYSFKLL